MGDYYGVAVLKKKKKKKNKIQRIGCEKMGKFVLKALHLKTIFFNRVLKKLVDLELSKMFFDTVNPNNKGIKC